MTSSGRVVVIGCDAMDAEIVGELAARGSAPTFQALSETAAFAPTANPKGFVVGGVWPTLWSGVWPNRHGSYANRQLVNGTYELRRASPGEITCEPFWLPIARAGRQVRVFDVPLAALRPHANCVQIVEWGGHDRIYGAQSSPPEELESIVSNVGTHALPEECDEYARRGAYQELRDDLLRGVEQRTSATLLAAAQPEWDLIVSVFGESHCAGHNLWSRRELLDEVYEAIDRALGHILAALPPDITVVVLLSHGVAPVFGADHLLGEVLRRLDDSYGAPSRFVSVREQIARPVERFVHERRLQSSLTSVDSARRFYKVPSVGLHSYVRFNLAGREPRGRVHPGAELERLEDALRRDLLELVDQDTGTPVVQDVWRTRDVYSGASIDDLPDLVIEWDPSALGERVGSARVGVVQGRRGGIRAGEHRDPGMLFVRGPNIAPGRLETDVRAVDLAPTVMAMLGVTAPDLDGRVVAALAAEG